MSHKDRMKRVEQAARPTENILQAILPDWLQDDSYIEPVREHKVIVPRGYMALQPDGSVEWQE